MSNDQTEIVTIRLLADFNHGGATDEVDTSEYRFTIIPPISSLPAASELFGWTLLGGVSPLEAGRIRLTVTQPLPVEHRVQLTVDGIDPDDFILYYHDGQAWQSLGWGTIWTLAPDLLSRGNHIKLSVLVKETQPAIAADICHRVNAFTLAAGIVAPDNSVLAIDAVTYRIAPFQLASPLDPVDQVLVVKNRLSADFVPALKALLDEIGVPLQVIEPGDDTLPDVWMQDTVEIGRYVVPGEDGPQQAVGVLTGLRAKHDGAECKPLDGAAREHFARQNAVLFDTESRPHTRWIDWYGNLEVSPPVTTRDGRAFPLGRVLVGKQHELTMHPHILQFLEAQNVQWPAVTVDTSWLEVGHVDEVVNFVPAAGKPGFRLLIPSTARAKAILAGIAESDPECRIFVGTAAETTAQALLDEVANSAENESIQRTLNRTRRMLCEELGIDEDDFIEIPALFREGQAVIPNCVNGLVVNEHVILPDPHGPQVDGLDAFAAPMRSALEALGLAVHFIDNWEPYHVRAGEVHCGTNAVRRVSTQPWWEVE